MPMIDTHCHIIPGVDDGSQDISVTFAMAAMAAEDGIDTIVATPHIDSTELTPEMIRAYVDKLNARFSEKGIPMTLVPGGEVAYFLHPSAIGDYSINNNGYILLEFPHSHMPATAGEIIRHLNVDGYRVVLAHPERNPTIIRDPNVLRKLVEETGAKVQITANSITGAFGMRIRHCSRHLLKKGWVDIIASDAHGASGVRVPVLSEALKVASKIMGKENAMRLVEDNPRAMVYGHEMF